MKAKSLSVFLIPERISEFPRQTLSDLPFPRLRGKVARNAG